MIFVYIQLPHEITHEICIHSIVQNTNKVCQKLKKSMARPISKFSKNKIYMKYLMLF